MWRFSYIAAEGGGAAFVVLYLGMTLFIGIPLIVAEFVIGRRTGRSPFGAVRALGGRLWAPLGFLYIVTPLLIMAYFSVIAGWTIRYAFDGLIQGFDPAAADRFDAVSAGSASVALHLFFVVITTVIVAKGVRKGIERASLLLVPALFLILTALAVWAATLPGAWEGYLFYLRPSPSALLDPLTLQRAASQAFLSLSVGMGVMITYASYRSGTSMLISEATMVGLADFSVAFVSGLVVFPVIFALNLSAEVGESTVGALFISLPSAFVQLGVLGRVAGVAFFIALILAGLTSSISLLEVGTSSLIDEFGISRKVAAVVGGLVAGLAGLLPAYSPNALAVFDKVAGELMVVVGAFGTALLAGWLLPKPLKELTAPGETAPGASARAIIFVVRWVVPPLVGVVFWLTLRDALSLLP
jgi:NSS family neurotransmitter:Na+ symporter